MSTLPTACRGVPRRRDPEGVERRNALATSTNRAYEQFWTRLMDLIHTRHPTWMTPANPPTRNWLPLNSDAKWFSYTTAFGHQGLYSELYIRVPGDPDASERILRYLQGRSDELEAAYGNKLSYEYLPHGPRPGRIACRLADYTPGNIHNVGEHDAYLDWFLDSQVRLRRALEDLGGLSLFREQAYG
jgi:hypothetical protein